MYLHRVSLVISQNLRQSGFSLGFTAGWKKVWYDKDNVQGITVCAGC